MKNDAAQISFRILESGRAGNNDPHITLVFEETLRVGGDWKSPTWTTQRDLTSTVFETRMPYKFEFIVKGKHGALALQIPAYQEDDVWSGNVYVDEWLDMYARITPLASGGYNLLVRCRGSRHPNQEKHSYE